MVGGAVLALALGWTRYRVEQIGREAFFQDGPMATIDARVPFLEGFKGSPRFARVVADIQYILAREQAQNSPPPRVFFGPRLEWGYAVFRRPSPKGLPIWWAPGVSFQPEAEESIVARFKEQAFDLLLFSRIDYEQVQGVDSSGLPEPVKEWVRAEYAPEARGPLMVLHRKHPGGSL